ncbi:MAG: branched-chain amino acid transport system ATP-binding protein [Actinomycetota bacterium]|jgi:sulfate-transporting ATPase|nr:branched-chain amino acid transport system ATP-binding protein [Actinomycetota bacterium]
MSVTFFLTQLALAVPLMAAYAMFALGIVLIYRASRVLNLAHGVMAMLPSYVVVELHNHGLPLPVALVAGVASGALLGALVELVFVRRLRRISETAQTVGTVAVFGLVVAFSAKVFGTAPVRPPSIFPEKTVTFADSGITYGQLGLIGTSIVLTLALFALFKFTRLGLAMRGAASNRTAAALMGVNPDRTTQVAWMLGGGLAAVAGILLSAVTTLDPYNFPLQALPGFVAALIGGLGSMPGALLGSVVVGLATGIAPALSGVPVIGKFFSSVGAAQLLLTVVAFAVMAMRGERLAASDVRAAGLAGSVSSAAVRKIRSRASRGQVNRTMRALAGGLLVVMAVTGVLGAPYSWVGTAITAMSYALVALSLVILTGWVGQISLAQASFVGIGAFVTGVLVRAGLPFPLTLPTVGLISAMIAALLGLVALRVRGLYLAVATLIFAWMTQLYLFAQPWLAGLGGSSSIQTKALGTSGTFPYLDFTQRTTFYFVMLSVLSAAMLGAANLRRSKTGRAWLAVKGSEVAAASLGIPVMAYKLLAFAVAGFMAGVAGNLLMTHNQVASASEFGPQVSLLFLAIAVVGGLDSIGGALAAGTLFALLGQLFYKVSALAGLLDIVSSLLLAVVLLAFPAGLAGLPPRLGRLADRLRISRPAQLAAAFAANRWQDVVDWRIRRSIARADRREAIAQHAVVATEAAAYPTEGEVTAIEAAPRRRLSVQRRPALGPPPDALAPTLQRASMKVDEEQVEVREREAVSRLAYVPGTATKVELPERWLRNPVLHAQDITVQFGGLTAVDTANLEVREGEIVGLIGPNGAGKTTLFNAISGLNSPTSGSVSLFDVDVTHLPVHQRAAAGMGRTFQLIQLFPELSVTDNLLVGTHVRNPSGFGSHLFATGKAIDGERGARQRVAQVVELLGLQDVANQPVTGLPFGVLRLVEVARALVTGAPFVMLDEPASGLDNAETDKLSDLLLWVRQTLGVSLLLIEHDVRMVTALCDYIYVLDRGKMIANGEAADIRRDPVVTAAYFGAVEEDVPQQRAPETDLAGVS